MNTQSTAVRVWYSVNRLTREMEYNHNMYFHRDSSQWPSKVKRRKDSESLGLSIAGFLKLVGALQDILSSKDKWFSRPNILSWSQILKISRVYKTHLSNACLTENLTLHWLFVQMADKFQRPRSISIPFPPLQVMSRIKRRPVGQITLDILMAARPSKFAFTRGEGNRARYTVMAIQFLLYQNHQIMKEGRYKFDHIDHASDWLNTLKNDTLTTDCANEFRN